MSTTTLKSIALVFMLIDHIATFIPQSPPYFHIIGRISAPIFLFCTIWGIYYTKNIKLYIKRLYIASIIMSLIQILTSYIIKFNDTYSTIENNFIRTLCFCCFLITILKNTYEKKTSYKNIILYIIYQIICTTINIILINANLTEIQRQIAIYLIPTITGNFLLLEGGIIFIILAIIIFITKKNKTLLALSYFIFCTIYFIIITNNIPLRIINKLERLNYEYLVNITEYIFWNIIGINPLYSSNYEWLMILALPLILLYNNKKGKNIKYFFYIFYPTHILLLYLLGNIMHNNMFLVR